VTLVNGAVDLSGHEWVSAEWRTEAEGWIKQTLAGSGLAMTGTIEQPRIRPWSTQLTVPTDRGVLWFKENTPAMHFEASLLEVLGRRVPDHVVAPLAVETSRGWMLTPDAGRTVAAVGHDDVETWCRIVSEYGDLQRRLVSHEDEILAAGVPVLRPADLPGWVEQYADELVALPAYDARRISTDDHARIIEHICVVRGAADRLVAGPIPLSLDHNDLHSNNAFMPSGDEPLRFFDFGDSLWAHPFGSMLVVTNVLGNDWGADDPRLDRVLDAYLDVWSDLADGDDLRSLLDAARVLGRIHRAHSWRLVLSSVPSRYWGEFGASGSDWLLISVEQASSTVE
jgi:hypothetical protein